MEMYERHKDFIRYFTLNSQNNLEFLDSFWSITPTEKDIMNFEIFSKVINLFSKGLSPSKIAILLNKSKGTVNKWVYRTSLPVIIRLLEDYLKLGNPKKGKWLSLNSTRGGLLIGPWIYVPDKINNYNDVSEVINQLDSLPESYKNANQFGVDLKFLNESQSLFLAYLLGVMVGDASKYGFQRSNRIMRRIQLKLTTKHRSNENFGNFVGLCVNCLGLKYTQCKNTPPSKKNKHPFYSWNSQSSLLISWMFNICLGLKDNEKTTYDKIKADWILNSPKQFRIWFLQGVADSDGYIDINTFQAGIVTFNKYVKLYRYKLMDKLANAKKFSHHWPSWLREEVDKHIKEGLSSTKIMHHILNKYNIVVRVGGISKRIRKHKEWQKRNVY